MKKSIIIIILSILVTQPALATEFNPNYIISDSEILDKTTMSLVDIQNFLIDKGGYISNLKTENFDGIAKNTAEIIYDAAVNNYDCDGVNLSDNPTVAERKLKCEPISINPRFLLVLLQKEQSLLDDRSPKQSQLDWATGYGCPDGGGCNERWRGIGKQINSAALQFYEYVTKPNGYKYKMGQTYVAKDKHDALVPIANASDDILNSPDKITVIPQNKATASLYTYTPHVYNGNYNFWKLWNNYFSRIFPDGTLAQITGEPGVWLIKNSKKYPFVSKGALTSRYDTKNIVQVGKSDLDAYLKGAPIKFAQYSIVRDPQGVSYLLVDDFKRKIVSPEVFKKLGFNPEEVESASRQDLEYYANGNPITLNDAYPTGALLQNPNSGGVYYVNNGEKAPLIHPFLLKTKFKNYPIIKSTEEELARYKKVAPIKFKDGLLMKSETVPTVYVISKETKRKIMSEKAFLGLGYRWENIMTVPPQVLALYQNGEPISADSIQRE